MRHRLIPAMAIALFTLVLFACGPGNVVRLLPPPIQVSNLPAPNAPSVSVVAFEDERLEPTAVGERRDGAAFTTSGDASQWVSRALADELARNGLRVTFASSVSQARSGNPDYLVTGSIAQIWLKEDSALEMSAQMRVSCTLANRKGKLWTETCNASQSKGALPTGGSADNLLLDTLRDLIKPLAQKIIQTVETNKN